MPGLPHLLEAVEGLGKPSWRPMLRYTAELHSRSIRPAHPPFPYSWEEIGPGYCYGPAFGHWDLIHQVLDVLPDEPDYARQQLLNTLAVQTDSGQLPGTVWMPRAGDPTRSAAKWSLAVTHPPVWPIAVQNYVLLFGDDGLVARVYEALIRQIHWFETHRKASPQGFYYSDILTFNWESGIDEGIRFQDVQPGPFACVDATSHLYALYVVAEEWSARLGTVAGIYAPRAEGLKTFIQERLFSHETGFFHDIWSVDRPERRPLALEGMWPLVVGAATESQAQRVIDENLLNPDKFFTPHPVSTVGVNDPDFELRMWRGPVWNSMTFWAARGCLRYGRADAARILVEQALDHVARQFDRTGTVWEFYHPWGDSPETLLRKPHTPYNTPCRDYLGHNPLIAMARIYDETEEDDEPAKHSVSAQ
jgi:putative isomerase